MIDISRRLYPGHPVWPGDTPFSYQPIWHISQGSSVNVGKLSTSTHLGTHLDAPWHYDDSGEKLEAIPLSALVGPCRVVDVQGCGELTLERVQGLELGERVLFFSGQPNRWESFPHEYMHISPAAVEHMSQQGVRLFGTDCPSVDPLESKTLPGHKAFAKAGIYIVEGLALQGVSSGSYNLVALPLPLEGADASPIRAILLSKD